MNLAGWLDFFRVIFLKFNFFTFYISALCFFGIEHCDISSFVVLFDFLIYIIHIVVFDLLTWFAMYFFCFFFN